jgi:hypothetical protein
MTDELKPCPFCGGRLTYNSKGIVEESRIDSWVGCEACGLRGPSDRTYYNPEKPDLSESARSKMRQASIDKWNALPRNPAPVAELPLRDAIRRELFESLKPPELLNPVRYGQYLDQIADIAASVSAAHFAGQSSATRHMRPDSEMNDIEPRASTRIESVVLPNTLAEQAQAHMSGGVAMVKELWKSLYGDISILSSAYQRKIDAFDAAIEALAPGDGQDGARLNALESHTFDLVYLSGIKIWFYRRGGRDSVGFNTAREAIDSAMAEPKESDDGR